MVGEIDSLNMILMKLVTNLLLSENFQVVCIHAIILFLMSYRHNETNLDVLIYIIIDVSFDFFFFLVKILFKINRTGQRRKI